MHWLIDQCIINNLPIAILDFISLCLNITFLFVCILILKLKHYWLTVWHTKMRFSITFWKTLFDPWSFIRYLGADIWVIWYDAYKTGRRIDTDEKKIWECYQSWNRQTVGISLQCWMCCHLLPKLCETCRSLRSRPNNALAQVLNQFSQKIQ